MLRNLRTYGLIAITVFLVYGNTINHDFAIDDFVVLSENKNVQKGLEAIPSIFSNTSFFGFTNKTADKTYRPLSLSLYAAEIEFFGLNPAVHHFFNLLYYTVLCLLLYYLLSVYLFKKEHYLLSLFSVMLFTLHPVHTEVVSNIKSRDEIMSFLFFALSLLFLFKYFKKNKTIHFAVSVLLYFAGLFTKETSVSFILAFPLIIYFFNPIPPARFIKIILPYVLALAVFLTIRHFAVKDNDSEVSHLNNALLAFDFVKRYLMAFYILLLYLKLLVFPHPLIWDYSYGHFDFSTQESVFGVASLLIHLGFFVYAVVTFRKKSLFSFCILFYLVTLAMVSNIFILISSTMAERFLFIPSFAFCIALVFGLAKIFRINPKKEKLKLHIAFTGIITVACIAFASMSFSRSKDWKDNYTITLADYKHSGSMRARLAYVAENYKRVAAGNSSPEVVSELQIVMNKLANSFPGEAEVWYTKGLLSLALNMQEDAIASYKKAIEINSKYLDALNNLGAIYHKNQQLGEALELYLRVISIDSNYSRVYGNIGMIFHQQNNLPEAKKYYEISLKFEPDNQTIRNNYGNLLKSMGTK